MLDAAISEHPSPLADNVYKNMIFVIPLFGKTMHETAIDDIEHFDDFVLRAFMKFFR